MNISVMDPIDKAYTRTKVALFRKFELSKWLTIGFSAWLAGLGERGGAHFQFSNWSHGKGGGLPSRVRVVEFVDDHLAIIITVAALVIVLILGITALIQWLSSRGKFMFYDNVVTDRALIGEPWRRYRAPAWNLFIFRLVLAIVIWFVVIGIAVAGVMIAWPDVTGGDFGINSMVALAVGVPAILAAVLIVMLITIALNDFVVPIMALRGMDSVMPALRVFASEILGVAPGTCLLYVLMRFILGIALSLLVLVLGCMTCCIGFCVFALPYVGTVVRLPIAYFFRSYPLYFIEQFGPQWRIFPAAAAASAAPPEPASPPVRGI